MEELFFEDIRPMRFETVGSDPANPRFMMTIQFLKSEDPTNLLWWIGRSVVVSWEDNVCDAILTGVAGETSATPEGPPVYFMELVTPDVWISDLKDHSRMKLSYYED